MTIHVRLHNTSAIAFSPMLTSLATWLRLVDLWGWHIHGTGTRWNNMLNHSEGRCFNFYDLCVGTRFFLRKELMSGGLQEHFHRKCSCCFYTIIVAGIFLGAHFLSQEFLESFSHDGVNNPASLRNRLGDSLQYLAGEALGHSQ